MAPSLAEGVAHVRECLGLDMPAGGHHREMGTSNHLLRLSDATFLEVIAVDPVAEPPPRMRWFGLSDSKKVQADWDAGRRLRGFVARTDDVDNLLVAQGERLGVATTVTRGTLSWQFGLRTDGAWPADGAAPCVIDWGPRGNPAFAMPDLGARLENLVLSHPNPRWVRALHMELGLLSPLRIIEGPDLRFEARIAMPAGSRSLT